jgi:hypothetical protein
VVYKSMRFDTQFCGGSGLPSMTMRHNSLLSEARSEARLKTSSRQEHAKAATRARRITPPLAKTPTPPVHSRALPPLLTRKAKRVYFSELCEPKPFGAFVDHAAIRKPRRRAYD